MNIWTHLAAYSLIETQRLYLRPFLFEDAEDFYKGYILHPFAFLCSNIVDSTFHQPQAGPPFSPERETFGKLSFEPTYKN